MTFGVQNHKNPKKRHFCEKPRKLAKTRKLGGVVLGVENRGFPGGVEKRRFSGVQNADFRVSQDFGTPRQNTYYLVCRHPPGGSIFTPPKTPKTPPRTTTTSVVVSGSNFVFFRVFRTCCKNPQNRQFRVFTRNDNFQVFADACRLRCILMFSMMRSLLLIHHHGVHEIEFLICRVTLALQIMFQLINMMMVEP